MPITRFRYGNLSIPKLYVTELNTLSGDLVLKRAGTTIQTLGATETLFAKHVKLDTDIELQDESGGALIAGDNAGNIDQHGRMDAALTSPSESITLQVPIGMMILANQSGTLNEQYGYWESPVADDYLYLHLSAMLPFQHLKGTFKLEKFTLYYNTANNADFITNVALARHQLTNSAVIYPWADAENVGLNDTGDDSYEYTPNYTFLTGYYYLLRIDVDITVAAVKLYSVKIVGQLT